MQIIRAAGLEAKPWKNGGGITREIALRTQGALLWRLSMADVASDGAFSDFSGYQRILTVIAGAGMDMASDEGVLAADPFVPVRFDGAMSIIVTLRNGPLRDLNLIFDPRRISGDVTPLHGPGPHEFGAKPGRHYALHCVQGRVRLSTGAVLAPGDTMVEASRLKAELAKGALAMLITLSGPGLKRLAAGAVEHM